MGKVKFRAGDGTIISESTDSITRGYKAGPVPHRGTGGQTADAKAGGGGGGAHGGDASEGGRGGGGGSGYSTGNVNTVVQLFGNTTEEGYIKFEGG